MIKRRPAPLPLRDAAELERFLLESAAFEPADVLCMPPGERAALADYLRGIRPEGHRSIG